jgi:predicted dehydrogenase
MTPTKLRAAIIGAGWYAAENHIPTLARHPHVTLDGVCRHGPADLEKIRAAFNFPFASENHTDLLARRPDIVVVASPHHLHYTHVRDALEAGAHVLCEKPMTVDPAEAQALATLATRLNRHLLIANGYHYLPYLPTIRARLAAGVIGHLEHITCTFVSATRPVFEGTTGFARWQTTLFRPDPMTWQNPAQGGGFAYGQMSHSIALMLWLTGLTPTTVAARSTGPGPIDLADAATIGFTSGATAAIGGAAGMPEGQRALLRLILSGTSGVMTLEFDRDTAAIHTATGTEHLPLNPGDWAYTCTGPVNTLVALAQGHGTNLSPAPIGATTVAILAAMHRSAHTNGTTQSLTP